MSSSATKVRKLPAWAVSSLPAHSQPADIKSSKETFQQQQSETSQEQFDKDVTGKFSGPNAAEVVPEPVNVGTKRPVREFPKLMDGVIFTLSGLVKPEGTELRIMALDMGAKYRLNWSADSTLLVCPFANTPTFKQVEASGGTIVHKDWIKECYNQQKLVAIEKYLLHIGKPWKTAAALDSSTDFGTADNIPGLESCEVVQQKSSGKCNSEFQTKQPARKHLKQHGNQGGAGMESSQVNHKACVPKDLASPAEVQQWVLEDLAATLTWLEQQSDKPEENELETVAAQGLLVCLEDAVRSLQRNKGLSTVLDNWGFIPRVVRELAVYEKCGQATNDQLVSEGERFELIYESQLKKLGFGFPAPRSDDSRAIRPGTDEDNSVAEDLKPGVSGETEKVLDDDATEIISNADSRDPADFDTDDTEELDENEITLCKEKILRAFRLN